MSEISIDDIPAHTPGRHPLPARPPVLDISTCMWTEKFCSMAAVLSTMFPEKAPDFFLPTWLPSSAQSVTLTTAGGWPTTVVTAVRPWRRRIWTGRSKMPASTMRRSREGLGQFPGVTIVFRSHPVLSTQPEPAMVWVVPPWGPDNRGLGPSRQPPPRGQLPTEPCRRYNAGTCRLAATACRYLHRCLDCGGPHPQPQFPRGGSRGAASSRSPIQRQLPPHSYGPPGPYPSPVPPGPR